MNESPGLSPAVEALLRKGVRMASPCTVEIDPSVEPARIAPDVVIHAGCRISGAKTALGPGCVLGGEAPAVVENCQLGRQVELKGGYFSGATFLDGASMGSGAHVRPGTLLEEEAGGAHAVGFKQTLLLPFVTAGSLVNFCDALMAGGTGRKNHSEIGSSYVHFNFTPHQDKATPSLIGDVPRGVMLDQPPIFLGGQGGLVGPACIAYGTLIPAGIICRRDCLQENQLWAPTPKTDREARPFAAGIYREIQRIVAKNLIYVGNVWALKAWYLAVRPRTFGPDVFGQACRAGALERLDEMLAERRKRLRELAGNMPASLRQALAKTGAELSPAARGQQQRLCDRWPEIDSRLQAGPVPELGAADRDHFLEAWERIPSGTPHVQAVAALEPMARKSGTAWLQAIVDSAAALF